MKDKFLSKIEINLPITIKIVKEKILSKIVNLFTDQEERNGITGCTYSIPSQPPVLKGRWFNKETNEVEPNDIIWIYACYDIEEADVEIEEVIKYIKQLIEMEGNEKLAWITYSSVYFQ